MLEKAEVIRCLRITSLINEKFDFLNHDKMRSDFLDKIEAEDVKKNYLALDELKKLPRGDTGGSGSERGSRYSTGM